MTIVYLLLPLALLIAGGFTAAFIWAAGNGQFDDLDTPAHRILLDDEVPRVGKSDDEVPRAGKSRLNEEREA